MHCSVSRCTHVEMLIGKFFFSFIDSTNYRMTELLNMSVYMKVGMINLVYISGNRYVLFFTEKSGSQKEARE